MTYASSLSDLRPSASAEIELVTDFDNERVRHSVNPSNLLLKNQATYCYMRGLALIVRKETVSEVFARNLANAMKAADGGKGIKQAALAAKTGVGQTTISLYLRPNARHPSASATPSPTLERVAALAKALGTEPWLLMHHDPEQARRAQDLIAQVKQDSQRPAQNYAQPRLRKDG